MCGACHGPAQDSHYFERAQDSLSLCVIGLTHRVPPGPLDMFSVMFSVTCDVRISVASFFLLGVSLEGFVGYVMCAQLSVEEVPASALQ